jgi:outer membrane autotransporter protein
LRDVRVENAVVEIGNANRLGFETTVDIEVSADLIDTEDAAADVGGELVKSGAEELTLRGVNSYSGGTTINAGTLRGNTDSLQGDIRNDALLIFDDFDEAGADGTYGGVISGTGAVEKVGTNEVTFSGDHSYTGGTTVREGTLRTTGLPSRSSDLTIESGAELIVDLTNAFPPPPDPPDPAPPRVFNLRGELNGSGTFVKRGPNEGMNLRGGGAFTGLTRIEGGTLTDASGALRGDIQFVQSGTETLTLAFDVRTSQTHSGAISGDGRVIKAGFGRLSLLGNNSYTGGTFLAGGTLIGTTSSIRGDVEVSGPAFRDFRNLLVFDQSFSGGFDGRISEVNPLFNALTLEKRGSGTVTLTNTVDATGGTTISQGRLDIDGILVTPPSSGNSIVPVSGATLGGTGFVLGNVRVEGIVSPGAQGQRGVLDVWSIDFESGSIFEVDIAEGDLGDTLQVLDSADLDGGLVRIQAASGSYATPSTVTILTANTLTGALEVETDFAFLDECLGTFVADVCQLSTGNSVQLAIRDNDNDLVSFAETQNQLTIAEVLELEAPGTPGSDMEDVFTSIRVIPTAEVLPMLDAVGAAPPFAVAGLPFALRPAAAGPEAALWRQMTFGRSGSASTFQPFEGDTGLGGWLDLWGSLGNLDGDGNSADVEYRSFGATLGVDYRLTKRISAGFAGGYSRSDIDLAGRDTEGDLDLAQGALYAGYVDPRFHLTASGRYGYSWNDSTRRIAFSDIDRTAKASFNSQDYGARAELGTSALRLGPVALAPLAAIDWAQLDRDGFSESGAMSLDLDVESDAITSLLSSVGASLRGVIDLGDDVAMMPELRAYWLHEFGDTDRLIRARLSGAVVSGSFDIIGAQVPRDRILAGLGWSASIGDVVRVFADYDVELASGLLAHELALTVRIHF